MADEGLQSLIDKLQGDVIDEARGKAEALLREAEAEAEACRAQAESDAERLRDGARRDAEHSRERGTRALEQAARDLLLATRLAILEVTTSLARDLAAEAMDADTVRAMLVAMAEAYAARGGPARRMSVLVSAADREALTVHLLDAYRARLGEGIELRVDPDGERGFRIAMPDEDAVHDLTLPALAEALAASVRPELARRLRAAAADPVAGVPHAADGNTGSDDARVAAAPAPARD